MKSLSTNLADYEFDDEILVASPKKDLLIDKPEMELMLNEAIALAGGKKYYALIDTSNSTDTTADARNYYSTSELSKYRYADAFVIRSLAVKLVFNFYIKFNKPPVITKMFTDRDSAMEWLLKIKAESVENNSMICL